MVLDGRALARGCAARGTELRTAEQLCRRQLDRFLAAIGTGRPVTVGCTQEAPLFAEEAAGAAAPLAFVNLREQAGWAKEGPAAGPKMAGLLAAAAVPLPDTPLVPLRSAGVTLVLGRDAVAIAAAQRLADRLDLTVLLTGAEPVTPQPRAEFPVLRGRARTATGWLGAFEVVVDGHAAASPASRAAYAWGPARDGATSRCDIILDLSGGPALFPAAETRQGYLRADPGDAAAVERALAEAGQLVGEFDKPRFVTFEAGLCAHGRNRRTGCTRCLDLCPTGAITPGKDSVLISAEICAGCGACAAVCPTGAATYALPPPATTLARLRALLLGYAEAGGRDAVVLLHDAAQGEPLLDALARHGDGLPARVLPLRLNEVSQLDLTTLAAAFAGAPPGCGCCCPAGAAMAPKGCSATSITSARRWRGWGSPPTRRAPWRSRPTTPSPWARPWPLPWRCGPAGRRPASCRSAPRARCCNWPCAGCMPRPAPQRRRWCRCRQRRPSARPRWRRAAPSAFACTMVCPTGAFSANPETPQLRFLEAACVQCGLCVATCPEQVISLTPRLNFTEAAAQAQVVKQEEPFCCTRCARPFGTRSSIERVKAKLAGSRHWMFADPARLAVLEMCEECRAAEATLGGIDPYAGPPRPAVRTTEDWLREAAAKPE